MGKHTDAVKPLDEFRAPWETESGEDAEIDKGKLKRFIHNLLRDKAQAQDSRDESLEKVKAAEADRDKAVEEAKKILPEDAQKTIDKLTAERDEFKSQSEALTAEKEIAELRKEILGDFAVDKRSKFVTGTTRDEIQASFDELKETFGIDDEAAVDDDGNPLETQPKIGGKLRSATDKGSGSGGDTAFDPEKAADQIMGGRIFG